MPPPSQYVYDSPCKIAEKFITAKNKHFGKFRSHAPPPLLGATF